MDRLEQVFRERFNIDNTRDILFITGSGALALEACVYSSAAALRTCYEGKFADQLKGYMVRHGKWSKSGLPCFIHYETSVSRLNETIPAYPMLVDCVSSFPFHSPPDCDVWVTVSGKQLGAPAGLGIVVVKRTCLPMFYERSESYLDLWSYVKSGACHQTPHTPSIYTMEQLLLALETTNYDMQNKRIMRRWHQLCEIFGEPPNQSPPVYTFPYRVNSHDQLGLYGTERTQLFLYSGTDRVFEYVLTALRDRIHAVPSPS